MSYHLPINEVKINYSGIDYIVNLTSDPTIFYVKSSDGQEISVSSETASNLFGAEQAILDLDKLYGQSRNQTIITSLETDFNNISRNLALQDVADLAGGIFEGIVAAPIAGPFLLLANLTFNAVKTWNQVADQALVKKYLSGVHRYPTGQHLGSNCRVNCQ